MSFQLKSSLKTRAGFDGAHTVVVHMKIENLVHEKIIMLLPYSKAGPMNHKANALTTVPARKHSPRMIIRSRLVDLISMHGRKGGVRFRQHLLFPLDLK